MASSSTSSNIIEEVPSYESLETPYVRMIVESNEVPWKFNLLASAANWILLAGYLVVPANNVAGDALLNTIQNPPLLAISCIFFVLGSVLIGWLFLEYKGNYIWLINRLFIPTLLNALAGLLTTIINIYTAHSGEWSIMGLLTVIASGLSVASSLSFFLVYKFGKLEKLKKEHQSEVLQSCH